MRMTGVSAIAVAMLSAWGTPALAQSSDDVVVMRRTVAPPRIDEAPSARRGEWVPSQWRFVSQAPACDDRAPAVRDASCVVDGRVVADRFCTGGKPQLTDEQGRYDGCVVGWTITGYGEWSSTCSTGASRTFQTACVRSGGSAQPVERPAAECTGQRPTGESGKTVLSGCTFSWLGATESDWTPWDSTCSQTAKRTRDVRCVRSDGAPATDAQCPAPKPQSSQTSVQTSGCVVYDGTWSNGVVFDPWGACTSGKSTRTSSVQCRIGTSVVSDSRCDPATRPVPVSETRNCSHVCEALTDQRKFPYESGTEVMLGTIAGSVPVATALEEARARCNAQVVNGPYPYRACYVSYYPGAGATMNVFFRYSNFPMKISNEGPGYTALGSCG